MHKGGDVKLTREKHLPWLLSAVTIYSMWLAGGMSPLAWMVGLLNQALWLIWIIPGKHWGFIPMNIALWIVFARNLYLWTQP